MGGAKWYMFSSEVQGDYVGRCSLDKNCGQWNASLGEKTNENKSLHLIDFAQSFTIDQPCTAVA